MTSCVVLPRFYIYWPTSLFAVPLTQISVDMWEQSGGKATKTITENGKKIEKNKN